MSSEKGLMKFDRAAHAVIQHTKLHSLQHFETYEIQLQQNQNLRAISE